MGEKFMSDYKSVLYFCNGVEVLRTFKSHHKAWKFAERLRKKGRSFSTC